MRNFTLFFVKQYGLYRKWYLNPTFGPLDKVIPKLSN